MITRYVLSVLIFTSQALYAGNIEQTAFFSDANASQLYHRYISSQMHADVIGSTAQYFDLKGKKVNEAVVGSNFSAFNGSVQATVLNLVPNKRVVKSWRNRAWDMATDEEIKNSDSILILTFRNVPGGAEIKLSQINIPDFYVDLNGEKGPLSSIVNTHWNILYWHPWRQFLIQN